VVVVRAVAWRSLATVVMVGTLTFAIPVVEANFAAADDGLGIVKVIGKALAAGGDGVEGSSMFAGADMICATGVGCAVLAAAAVGVALYATQDTWVPWVKREFGAGTTGTTGDGCGTVDCVTITVLPAGPGTGFTVRSGELPNGYLPGVVEQAINYVETCQAGDGSVSTTASHFQYVPTWGAYVGSTTFSLMTAVNLCPGGGTITGIALTDADPPPATDMGPVTWGTTPAVPDSGTAISNQVNCINPDGSTFSVTQGVASVTGSLAPMPTCTGAAGSQPGAHGVCSTLSAGPTGGALTAQSSDCAAAAAGAALYPLCSAGQVCSYAVRVDGITCSNGEALCVGWASIYASDPARVSCQFGPYAVPVSQCGFLERAYEPGGAPATNANTDGNPQTWTGPGPAGQPGNGAATDPSAPAAPLPVPAPIVGPTPGQQDCWPSGWSVIMDPSSWVLMPTECAMRWAFVPQATVMAADALTAKNALNAVGIAPVAAAVGANFALIGSGSGCAGPAVTFAAVGITKSMYPFSACASPMSTLASISYALSYIAIMAVGGFSILRAIGTGFGFSVTMGRRGGGSE